MHAGRDAFLSRLADMFIYGIPIDFIYSVLYTYYTDDIRDLHIMGQKRDTGSLLLIDAETHGVWSQHG